MKAGLFGGDWDDIRDAIDDYFSGLTGSTPDLPPLPGPDAPVQPVMFRPAMGDSSEATMPAMTLSPAVTPSGASAGGVGSVDTPASALNPYSGIDYSVIAGHEGSRLDPYVPRGSASSGVTVATGVDLSEHTAAELRDWGVSEDTIAKLSPFLKPDGLKPDGTSAMGLKGDAARAKLNEFQQDNPSSGDLPRYEIDLSDALAMNNGALRSIAGQVQKAYDAANPSVPFLQLAAPTRTAILDLAYQYGPALAARAPAFWQAATTGDWNGAADELHNWTAAQKADPNAKREQRRLDEEALIRPGIGGSQLSR